jgi:hypothetical protein
VQLDHHVLRGVTHPWKHHHWHVDPTRHLAKLRDASAFSAWELRYFLYATYLKAQNRMYSNFRQSWIHRQSAFTNYVPDREKKNPAIEGPPTLYLKVRL